MSSSEDSSARLSSALEEILSGTSPNLPARDGVPPDEPPPAADWSVDDDDEVAVADEVADGEAAADAEGEADGEVAADGESVGPATNGDDATAPSGEPTAYELPTIVPATADPSPPPITPPVTPATETAPTARPAAPVAPRPGPTTSWSDHVAPQPASGGLRAPGRRPRVRRVTRVVRHIDPWTTFKVALVFSAVAYVVLLTAGVLLWRVADSTGTLDNVERWFTQFGWETFELQGGEIFHNAWIIGLFGVVALTGGLVLLATLFNLVSDIVGGIRVTVLEEEVVERTISSTRRYVVRRSPTDAAVASAQNWDVDGDVPTDGDTAPSEDAVAATWSVDDDAGADDGDAVDEDAAAG